MLIDLRVFSLQEIIPHINERHSKRLRCFAISTKCVTCGIKGHHFTMQYDTLQLNAHLNFFTKNGILITKDHIQPVSKGGSNEMSNLQTMCSPCNNKKGNKV